MVTTPTLAFGDVVLVPFPFTDQAGSEKRPAVVVSSRAYNSNRRDLVVMAVSSQVRQPLAFGEALVSDWQAAGLIQLSVFKPLFTTIEQGLVIRTLGSPPDAGLATLGEVIGQAIG